MMTITIVMWESDRRRWRRRKKKSEKIENKKKIVVAGEKKFNTVENVCFIIVFVVVADIEFLVLFDTIILFMFRFLFILFFLDFFVLFVLFLLSEHLGSDFIDFLLNHIENPPDTDVEDQVPDLFIALILSYNLQFKNSQDNVVVKSLSQRPVAKVFTEKILLLLNREGEWELCVCVCVCACVMPIITN